MRDVERSMGVVMPMSTPAASPPPKNACDRDEGGKQSSEKDSG